MRTYGARELFGNLAVNVSVLTRFRSTLAIWKAKEDVIFGNQKVTSGCLREALKKQFFPEKVV